MEVIMNTDEKRTPCFLCIMAYFSECARGNLIMAEICNGIILRCNFFDL